ncbi:hypothetical protein L596_009911 [Steinernema carpocapsae]|uniref:UPAR/Ly6 domain-containing protein n=1 Tax=Steinernema carpocapsae TaxID=34508 RepID=A0A4U5PGP9_STECR|nr:hypothetical protein L596_009911 [Steinernema carpocapsae]
MATLPSLFLLLLLATSTAALKCYYSTISWDHGVFNCPPGQDWCISMYRNGSFTYRSCNHNLCISSPNTCTTNQNNLSICCCQTDLCNGITPD